MRNGLLTDHFDQALNGPLFQSFSGFFKFDKVIFERGNKSSQMASVLAF